MTWLSKMPMRPDGIFSATFYAVAAPIRVEPFTTSGAVSNKIGWSAPKSRAECGTFAIPMTVAHAALAPLATAKV